MIARMIELDGQEYVVHETKQNQFVPKLGVFFEILRTTDLHVAMTAQERVDPEEDYRYWIQWHELPSKFFTLDEDTLQTIFWLEPQDNPNDQTHCLLYTSDAADE